MTKTYEFRDPIHGYVELDEWERDIINQPAFQRLRRIKQLAWTDMIYPGATHSRFEHSLGVMHVATRLFDALCKRNRAILESELGYKMLERQRKLIRLAALLHDIGHAPFSHAAEEILPIDTDSEQHYTHEQYSAAIVQYALRDVIESHPDNQKNYGFTVKDLSDFFLETPSPKNLLWRDLVSSQMDADRMDYLLRDAHHAGVAYGKYDLDRLAATVTVLERPDKEGYTIGVEEDGVHAAEGLILARYMMFTQVYFHKTRIIYDYHLIEALKEILRDSGGHLPPPNSAESINDYLNWDDWRIFGVLAASGGDEHGRILRERKHYRLLRHTREVPDLTELEWMDQIQTVLIENQVNAVRRDAEKSWYKFEKLEDEVLVSKTGDGTDHHQSIPLSSLSPVVKGLQSVRQSRIYVPASQREMAEAIVRKLESTPESRS